MTTHLTDEQLMSAVVALKDHGSQCAAASALGMSRAGLQSRLRRAAERGLMGYNPVLPGYHIKKISSGPNGDYIQQTKEPGEEFALPSGHVVKGVSALVDPEGRIVQQWIKTKTDSVAQDLVVALKAEFDSYAGNARPVAPPTLTDANLLSVYPIADQHNGLLAWGRETGESYDLKIGAARLRECMASLVAQSPRSKQAIILNLGDFQHTDDQRNMTPGHGNLLDVDSRYFKILTAGVRLMMDCIQFALAKHESVLVRNIPGNHDPHASIALTVALNAFYSSDPRVTVDMDPSDFFFHRFGSTLMGATHGHKMKPEKMAMFMATRCREDWGDTKYHWFLHGHIHHEVVKEIGDVRVESFQTLAANDAYSASHGYTSGKSLTSITLDRTRGEIGRHRINIPPPCKPESLSCAA